MLLHVPANYTLECNKNKICIPVFLSQLELFWAVGISLVELKHHPLMAILVVYLCC